MEKFINDSGKECYRGLTLESPFDKNLFSAGYSFEDDKQSVWHTNLGSITVLDRMTGYGFRDVETGFRDKKGNFWLASGNFDVRELYRGSIGGAINLIKDNANTCIPEVSE